MRKLLSTPMFSPFFSVSAFAHEGHSLAGMHWHAGDVVGVLAFGALIGMVIWHLRR